MNDTAYIKKEKSQYDVDRVYHRSRRKRKIHTVAMGLLTFVICALMFSAYARDYEEITTPGFIAALLALAGMVFLQFTLPKLIADILLPD